uniref:Uncharacterized protein n=1 Tax=Nelumbo nucifera TaxID=4432 RepID=A0A822YNN0_NELNU|nr:TPA_asm: hypothetical protein HUJ06_004840 [Nelumbo nucifera]
MISLDEYVDNMKPEQKDIYYIASDSLTSARNTPFLERLVEKDFEVLFLVDPIDEEDLDLGDKNEEKEKEAEEFGQTCDWIKKHLGNKVTSVQISNHLSTSPCVLVSGKFGWSANMERQAPSCFKMKILAAYKTKPDDGDALRAIDLLYDTALISSVSTPENPAQLGGKIYEMMRRQRREMGSSETVEAEVVEPVEVGGQK